MSAAPLPENELQRLKALSKYDILDSVSEPSYDDLTMLASYICETPIALVSIVDKDRQWFKSKVGICTPETDRDSAFCAHTILKPESIMIVNDALKDERFKDNSLVTGEPHIRFYCGVPLITSLGYPLGSLCVIDSQPRTLNEDQKTALIALARAVSNQLDLRLLVNKYYEHDDAAIKTREKLIDKTQEINSVDITFLTTTKSGVLSFIMKQCDAVGLLYRRMITEKVSDSETRLIVYFKGKLECEEAYLIKKLEENPEIFSVENVSIFSSNIKTSALPIQETTDASIKNKKAGVKSSIKHLNANDIITADSLRIAEENLVGVIGPVASILVNSASKKTKHIGDLFLLLARELEGEDRIDFLSLVQGINLKDQI